MFEKAIAALLACCCTAGLFACIPAVQEGAVSEGDGASGAGTTPAGASAPVSSNREIEGKWDIVSFDGYEPARLNGSTRVAFADFGDSGVSLRIECNYSGAAGVVVDGRFEPRPDDGMQTAMGCGEEREARDAALFSFFDRKPTVERLPDGKLLLRAGRQELVLQRPDERRLAFIPRPADLEGEWRLVGVTRYLDGNGYAGIGLSEVPGRVIFTADRASYSRCSDYDFGYRYTEDGRLLKTSGGPVPASPADCRELSGPRQGSGEMPVQWDALRVLHASPMVEWAGPEEILISTERIGLVLSRAACRTVEQSDDHFETREVDCASPR